MTGAQCREAIRRHLTLERAPHLQHLYSPLTDLEVLGILKFYSNMLDFFRPDSVNATNPIYIGLVMEYQTYQNMAFHRKLNVPVVECLDGVKDESPQILLCK